MQKVIRLSIANIKKHRKESILLGILVAFTGVLIASAMSSIVGIGRITPNIVSSSECYKNFVQINQEDYTDKFLAFFEENESIKRYNHVSMVTEMLKIKDNSDDGEDKFYDISFVSVGDEELLERFDVITSLSEDEIAGLPHPIYLDKCNEKELDVSVGDTLTVLFGKREFTFTVAGFYQSGLWTMGTKAVVSQEDFAYMEEFLERYEMIVADTKEGTDNRALLKEFEAFAKDISVNDISASLISYSFEDMVSTNNTNMSLLSVIVAVMAGVIVIAVIVMIRFRIVSDINEQLVSIGVLEAIGYRSGEIALSYIVEYVIIALFGVIVSIIPAVALTGFLLDKAASTVHYGGEHAIPVIPIILSMMGILIFIALTALTKALSVRKYPPVLAFRKGIATHHFKRTYFPLEKTKGNIHVRLALKGFIQSAGQNVGLTVCITAATIMVLTSFMIGSFFANSDRVLRSVCGHELPDVRIETVGGIDRETFAEELASLPDVNKVLTTTDSVSITFPESEVRSSLDVYKDYSDTETIILIEGRLPVHDNELAVTTQVKGRIKVKNGDTISVEYGKVKRDYVVCGFVNSVIDSNAAYMTEDGFKKLYPLYNPNLFSIYLNEGADREAFTDFLTSRYGEKISDICDGEVTGDTLEEKIKSAAEIKMAKAMTESGVSYMEYAIRVGDEVITGSTSTMKIKSMTYVKEDYKEMVATVTASFAAVSVILMIVSAIVVMIILSILMASTIRKQYKELGIMKGIGYTSKELKFQMAARIIPPTIIAVLIGTILSILLLGSLEMLLAKITVSVISVVVTDIVILLFTFGCAYKAAGKIGKISVYELMTE